MPKTFLCLLGFLITINTYSQNTADSFVRALKLHKTYAEQANAYIAYVDKIGLQNFDNALRFGKEGLALAEKNSDPVAAGQLQRQIGEAYYFKGKYDEAASLFYRSVANLEKTDQKVPLAAAYNALAKLYRKTRDLGRSMENYDKAMAIFRALNDSAGMAVIYNESGVVFEYDGKYDKAAERYSASLHIDERLHDTIGICYALSNLAGVYTLQNKFTEAENYLLQTLFLRKQMNDSFALSLNYSDLGNTYFLANDLTRARAYLDTGNMIADIIKYPELKGSNYDLLAQIAEKQGNFALALDLYKKKYGIRDSIFSIEKTKQIEELSTKYETEKKERQIEDQQNKIALQNILMGAAILLVLLGGWLGYTQYRRYLWRHEAKTQAQMMKQQELATKAVMEAEEAERHRIATDLHDGVGQIMSAAKMNLSAYQHRVKFDNEDEKVSFDKIISLVDAGCKEVRSVSHNMMPNALVNTSLASAIREFIDKLDHHSLKVHLFSEGFDESLRSDTETVLYRIIQECVNNVIKHSEADVLDISMIKEADEISVTIEDNGKGFDIAENENNEGIGLKNIRTRIEYLKGTVDFKSSPGKGTLVALHIPVGKTNAATEVGSRVALGRTKFLTRRE